MQSLTAAPREGMDPDVVMALLTGDDLEVSAGLERVDNDGRMVEDLSAALVDGSVSWDGSVDVHRECSLVLNREIGWDRDRVRPYLDLSSDLLGVRARWWLGVFILTSPSESWGAGDERTVAGLDLLHLLACPIGNTLTATKGTKVLAWCRDLVARTSFGPRVFFDSAGEDATFTEDMVWPLIPATGGGLASTTWLQPLAEALSSIGFEKPWVDEAGQMRARPLVPVSQRTPEHVLSADDVARTILGPVRQRQRDLTQIPNAWIFVAQGWDLTPVEGDGLYTPPDNLSVGPTSITARNGHRVLAVRELPAQTQAALVAQAATIVEADQRAASKRTVEINPFPMMGHGDVYQLEDAEVGAPVKAAAAAWTVHLNESNGSLTMKEVPT